MGTMYFIVPIPKDTSIDFAPPSPRILVSAACCPIILLFAVPSARKYIKTHKLACTTSIVSGPSDDGVSFQMLTPLRFCRNDNDMYDHMNNSVYNFL